MKRMIQKALAVAVLAVGLAMLVWGGRGFASNEQSKPATATDDEGGPALRIGPDRNVLSRSPARRLACLTVAGVSLFIAGGSMLSLIPKKEQA